jgi:vitamin K-dependent gamma-carboxylase
MAIERARVWLGAPVDATGVACFRIAFGLLMAASSVRFVAKGWIASLLVAPRFHFAYPGFSWLAPWPAPWLYAHFALMTLAALGVAFGCYYRASALLLLLTFTSAELFDQTYYLNHYYLATLCAALCCALPLQRAWSLDAWRARRHSAPRAASIASVPRAVPLLLRAQLAIVYGYAGLAKLDGDWLLRGEPLRTWLQVHAELPVVGPLLQLPAAALALSWAGALFDLTIVLWLCLPRTRALAYCAVIAFHAATALLFPIGVFPWLMIALTPIFFAHDWPRRRLPRVRPAGTHLPLVHATQRTGAPLSLLGSAALALYLLVQLTLPLRHLAYPGAVNWSEQGFRYAWRVMLVEKTGHVAFRVLDRERGEQLTVAPRAELTARQIGQMSTQPLMIAAYAQHLADEYRARGHRHVSVYADAWASLNGRPAQRLLDPRADLAHSRPLLASDPAILPLANFR